MELATDHTRLIIGAGLPLDDFQDPPKRRPRLCVGQSLPEGLAPPVPGLFTPGPKVDAILLSHAHTDHASLLAHTPGDVPIYLSQGRSKMLPATGVFAGQEGITRAPAPIAASRAGANR